MVSIQFDYKHFLNNRKLFFRYPEDYKAQPQILNTTNPIIISKWLVKLI